MTKNCKHCSKEIKKFGNLKRHEDTCRFRPENKNNCLNCGKEFYPKKKTKCCGYACSNTYFRSGEQNGNWKQDSYRSTCFLYHDKECVICEENVIVEVHHLDGNHNNNDPSNLIPLCPTHHKYWHSGHKHLIESGVKEYITHWLSKRELGKK